MCIYTVVTNIMAILSNVAMIFYLWKENKRKKKKNIVNKDITRVENGNGSIFHVWWDLSLQVWLYPLLSMESSTLFSMPLWLVIFLVFILGFC